MTLCSYLQAGGRTLQKNDVYETDYLQDLGRVNRILETQWGEAGKDPEAFVPIKAVNPWTFNRHVRLGYRYVHLVLGGVRFYTWFSGMLTSFDSRLSWTTTHDNHWRTDSNQPPFRT